MSEQNYRLREKRFLRVKDFFAAYGGELLLKRLVGEKKAIRAVSQRQALMAGLVFLGFTKNVGAGQILIIGPNEQDYLQSLSPEEKRKKIRAVLLHKPAALILADGQKPLKELFSACLKQAAPLFVSALGALELQERLFLVLSEPLAPSAGLPGTLVEIFGLGVLLKGESGVGKSEIALGLLERGHRLIADDLVTVKRPFLALKGYSHAFLPHLLWVRPLGPLNMAGLKGAAAVSPAVSIDLAIDLRNGKPADFFSEEYFFEVLGFRLPCYPLEVKPGRELVLVIESLVLNHRLKQLGGKTRAALKDQLHRAIEGGKA
ncbi:MAG: hypothetical protein WC371_06055 [Parachlamydiales bacterium]